MMNISMEGERERKGGRKTGRRDLDNTSKKI